MKYRNDSASIIIWFFFLLETPSTCCYYPRHNSTWKFGRGNDYHYQPKTVLIFVGTEDICDTLILPSNHYCLGEMAKKHWYQFMNNQKVREMTEANSGKIFKRNFLGQEWKVVSNRWFPMISHVKRWGFKTYISIEISVKYRALLGEQNIHIAQFQRQASRSILLNFTLPFLDSARTGNSYNPRAQGKNWEVGRAHWRERELSWPLRCSHPLIGSCVVQKDSPAYPSLLRIKSSSEHMPVKESSGHFSFPSRWEYAGLSEINAWIVWQLL